MWIKFKAFLGSVYDFWIHDLGTTLRDSDDYVSLPRLMWFLTGAMMVSLVVAVFCGWTTEHMQNITDMVTAAFATGATAYVGKKGADAWTEKIRNVAQTAVDATVGKKDEEQKEDAE